MGGVHDRGRGPFLLPSAVLTGALLVAVSGCAISGKATATPVPVQTSAQVEHQAITNLAEAGVLHYQGSLTSSASDQLTVDLLVTASGEASGTVALSGQQAQVADLSGRLYVNAPQAFWTAIADLPSGSTSAAAGTWVTVPIDFLGVDPATMLTPAAIGAALGQDFTGDDTPISALHTTSTVNGVPQIQFNGGTSTSDSATVSASDSTLTLGASAPHGITRFQTTLANGAQLTASVTDSSATEANVYQSLAQQATQLQSAVDPSLDIEEGNQTWGACGATSCSVNVTFTNSSSVSTKVLVTGNWTGDNSPVGTCQVVTAAVAPSTTGTATCTVTSPQWAAFYHTAQTVPGDHPYELQWAALALAEPPNEQVINTEATEAATPAPKKAGAAGHDYVYVIDYQDRASHAQVWKYGVTTVGSWQDYANTQVASCIAENGTSCLVSLVTAAANRPSADALVSQLVAAATTSDGKHCPPGQWAYCR